MMSMTSLLIHDEQVPHLAREALRAASHARAAERTALLFSAARILSEEVGLPCEDVRELVGLDGECG